MTFPDQAHFKFYEQMVQIERAEQDVNRKALFYALGLTEETRIHIRDLYDFCHHSVLFSGLRRDWQTSDSRHVCRLALNLYNGYCGHDDTQAIDFAPYYLFDTSLLPLLLEAVKVRFPAKGAET